MKHRWPKEGTVITRHKTERECLNGCGIVKVTRHESDGPRNLHWVEFWRDMDRIECSGTPVCEPVGACRKSVHFPTLPSSHAAVIASRGKCDSARVHPRYPTYPQVRT